MNTAIYCHIPFCRRRCPYCDFYLVVESPIKDFVTLLINEWAGRKKFSKAAQSLYFGGGTPSLIAPKDLDLLINFFLTKQVLQKDAEITIEANPEDLTENYLAWLKLTAINRISLGIQSFDNKTLKRLGRKHDEELAKKVIADLKCLGFENISVDLIIGVFGESPQKIIDSLRYLDREKIFHISTYLLTIEEKTKFYDWIKNGRMSELNEDRQAAIYRLVQKELLSLGYEQYDISSFAKNNRLSRHNQIYWADGAYIGLGPFAHSLYHLPDGGLLRLHNKLSLAQWRNDPTSQKMMIKDRLDPKKALKESLAFGLRNMKKGVNFQAQSIRHKAALPDGFFKVVQKYRDLGWLEECQGTIKLTHEGAMFGDAIMRDVICC